MHLVIRWADRLAGVMLVLSTITAILMTLFVVLASVMRYGLGSPFAFTEELVGLLFTTMIFLGVPICTLRNSHIAVTILPDMMRPRMRGIADRLASVLVVVFCVWFGYLSFGYMQTAIELDARSAGSRLLLWPWTAILPLSCLFAGIAALLRVAVHVPAKDPAHNVPEGHL